MIWAFAGPAAAHDFSIIVVGPSPTWCEEIAEQAAPADVIHLLPGTYPGGCELALGGLVELNEALLVTPIGEEPVVIEADDAGVALRITGEPTRLLGLTVRGRVVIEADNATIDTCQIDDLHIASDVQRVTVLFSVMPAVVAGLSHAVVRGNRLDEVDVIATTGLVADNAVSGNAWSSLPFHRNLVVGDLRAYGDAFANVITGVAEVDGRFQGNTAFGPVLAVDARNNLTTAADLPTSAGNLRCPSCLVDPAALDVRPQGAALDLGLVDSEGDTVDFCGVARTTIGAVGPLAELVGQPWTAFDRTRTGCVPGVPRLDPPPEPPEPFVETSEVQPRTCSSVGVVGPWWIVILPLWRTRRCGS